MAGASSGGDQERVRAAELELRVEEARRNSPDGLKDEAEAATRRADASERELHAAQALGEMRASSRELKEEYNLLKYSGDELKVQEAILREKNRLQREGIPLASKEAEARLEGAEALAREQAALDAVHDRVRGLKDAWKEATDGIGKAMTDGFNTAFTKGKGAGKVMFKELGDAGVQFIDRILEKMVLSPLMKALETVGSSVINSILGVHGNALTGSGQSFMPDYGGFGGGIGTGSAYGNVFSAGSIIPHAAGGVVSRPSLFPMSGGRTGSMAENEPEGILPLQRGADGRLGVQATGGGGGGRTEVQIIDQRGSRDAEAIQVQDRESSDGRRQLRIMVRDTVKDSMRRTEFDTDFRTQYGVGRTVAKR